MIAIYGYKKRQIALIFVSNLLILLHIHSYSVGGPIFFGSIKPLMDLFPDPRTEPKNVTVLFEQAEVHDWSGMMAIKRLHERFENNDATVQFQQLNVASRRLMHKSKDLWEGVNVFAEEDVDVEDDPLVKHDHVHENTHM